MNAADTHVHIFDRRLAPVAGARYVPAYDAVLEDLIAVQDGAGITHAVLVQPSFLGTDNSWLLSALEAHPRRLRATVVVDAGLERSKVAAWDALGVRGIRFNLFGAREIPDLGSRGWSKCFSTIAEFGWHVELHANPAQVAAMLDALAGCAAPLVFDHFALPDPASGARQFDRLTRLGGRQGVYVKLSGAYRLSAPQDAPRYARQLLETLGAGRLLWGSDWPWTNHESATSYAACVRNLEQWVPEPEDRRQILWDTAMRLFRFA